MLIYLAVGVQIYFYGVTNEGPLDSWFCFFAATCLFWYNTLDNCDGKQARRTKSGSVMGMLFDHGCDAFVAIFNSFLLIRMFSVGTNPY